MKKKFLSLTLFIVLVISLSSQVFAYSTLGCKQPSTSIKYCIGTYESADDKMAWSDAIISMPSKVTFTSVAPRHGEDIYCTSQSDSNVDWDGLTCCFQTLGYFTSCTCYLNNYYTNNYSYNRRQSVAAHELGHALGLADLGSTAPALMNGYTYNRFCVYGIYTPQTDDINGINWIYK